MMVVVTLKLVDSKLLAISYVKEATDIFCSGLTFKYIQWHILLREMLMTVRLLEASRRSSFLRKFSLLALHYCHKSCDFISGSILFLRILLGLECFQLFWWQNWRLTVSLRLLNYHSIRIVHYVANDLGSIDCLALSKYVRLLVRYLAVFLFSAIIPDGRPESEVFNKLVFIWTKVVLVTLVFIRRCQFWTLRHRSEIEEMHIIWVFVRCLLSIVLHRQVVITKSEVFSFFRATLTH